MSALSSAVYRHVRWYPGELSLKKYSAADLNLQIINALLCCAAGFNSSRVPLVEADYRETYSLLSVFVEKDWNHPQLGQHVQSQLARSILGFRYDSVFRHFSY